MLAAPDLPRIATRPRDLEGGKPTVVEREPVTHAAALQRLASRIEATIPRLRTDDEKQQARGAVRRARAWARQLLRLVRRAG